MDAADGSKVLVVDDEPQITRVLRTVLVSQGYQVRTAAEGEGALASFQEWNPELVITDLYMPHMDGIELCRRIRAVSAVPIIVLSVKGEERSKVEALDSGADDYVTKPFGIDELLARVRAALRRGAAERDGGLIVRARRLPNRLRRAARPCARQRSTAHAEGVRPVRLHGAAAEPRPDARVAAGSGVGRRQPGTARISARVHGPATQETRAGSVSAEIPAHRTVGRLPIQSEGELRPACSALPRR